MKALHIDTETTGADPMVHEIIEVGAILEDLEDDRRPIARLPRFHAYVLPPDPDRVCVSYEAVYMNVKPMEIIGRFMKTGQKPTQDTLILKCDEVVPAVQKWVSFYFPDNRSDFYMSGMNIESFDYKFLKKMPGGEYFDELCGGRFIDVAHLYKKDNDKKPISLQGCLDRAGIHEKVTHHPLIDIAQCIKLIRIAMDSE